MLKIYNTLTGGKEEFRPINAPKLGMYACGVTVYDHSHLGHARGAVVFDVVRKYLLHKGYKTTYVRNFTDVDDKIIKRAAESGMTWKEVAEKYTQEYIKDMEKLGVDRPDFEPKATEHIPEIIGLVKKLEEKGFAYESGGDVFFSVRKFRDYGKLSKKPIDEMEAGARVDVDERKQDPLDFVLWKASKPGEPAWDSPWGKGRPGWHIECSAMSIKHLGETFDIHGGGMDLQFPHHENEIAQAEAATGKPFVHYWMHNGFVNVNREKMSKSLGNFFTIKEILENYEPEVVRFFLLATHYRSPIDFSDQSLQDSRAAVERYYTMLEGVNAAIGKDYQWNAYKKEALSPAPAELHKAVEYFNAKFEEAMDDDFNTASAMGSIFELVREVNRATSDKELLASDLHIKDVLAFARDALAARTGILNLFKKDPDEWFGRAMSEVEVNVTESEAAGVEAGFRELGRQFSMSDGRLKLPKDSIEGLINDRKAARASKDWKKADAIRGLLLKVGIELLDGPEGTKWQIKE